MNLGSQCVTLAVVWGLLSVGAIVTLSACTLTVEPKANTDANPTDGGQRDGASFDAPPGVRAFSGTTVIADDGVEAGIPANNCGICSEFDGGNGEAGLVRIEVSSLPAGAVVRSATLTVYLGNLFTPGGTTSVFELLEDWVEGDKDYEPGVPNFTMRKPGVAWTTPGAGPGSRAATSFATFTPAAQNVPIEISVPAALVQRWRDQPSQNFGIAFAGSGYPGGGGDHPHFVSTESPDAATQGPRLVVEFD